MAATTTPTVQVVKAHEASPINAPHGFYVQVATTTRAAAWDGTALAAASAAAVAEGYSATPFTTGTPVWWGGERYTVSYWFGR